MKFAVLIPTRGDRVPLLENCKRMLAQQTVQPDHIEIVDFMPRTDACDITVRYRFGYEKLSKMGFDVIFFIEDDDWYAKNYFETMIFEWEKAEKPAIFGTTYTWYYNLRVWGRFKMEHFQRSSAMSTMIKPNLHINWPLDHDPYTDVALFFQLQYALFTPNELICLGIKHGYGKCGGESHINSLARYSTNTGMLDTEKKWLQENIDAESFDFYTSLQLPEVKLKY